MQGDVPSVASVTLPYSSNRSSGVREKVRDMCGGTAAVLCCVWRYCRCTVCSGTPAVLCCVWRYCSCTVLCVAVLQL